MSNNKLDWQAGTACKMESLMCVVAPTSLNLMHTASTYVEHNMKEMSEVEFDYFFSTLNTCLHDIKQNPSLIDTKNGLLCLEKANSICSRVAVSRLNLNPLQHATLTGIRGRINGALRRKVTTIFYTPSK